MGAIQGVLLSFLLLTRKTNHTANVVLAAGMFALSVDIFHSAFIIFGYYTEFPHFIGVTYAFPFLYGPVFFLYAKLISTDNDSFQMKYYLHFIPFILVVIYGLLFVYFRNAEFKIELVTGKIESLNELILISYFKPVHGLIYVFLTIRVVKVYNKRIRNSYSNIERINLNWLRYLTTGLSIIWGIVTISYIVNIFIAKKTEMDHLIYMAASVLIYSIGYLSLRQPRILEKIEKSDVQELDSKTVSVEVSSYQKSGLTETEAQIQIRKLVNLMETSKPYLNSELTLRELAGMLSISAHNLSEILNTRLNQNFYDFVNHYRVEEVKRRLADTNAEKYSLLAIAFDAGFNSKSSFNTIFKKQTNTTPSNFRKQLLRLNPASAEENLKEQE